MFLHPAFKGLFPLHTVLFWHLYAGGITYPPVAVAVSEQPGAGFISAEKTAFSEWVLCADGHAVPSCTQCFFGTSVWGVVSLPSGRYVCVGTTPRGVISAEKAAFSEWVLCADECAVPSCTQRFFGVPAWGWYHYPRHAIHAVETLDARGSRRRIRRFYAAPEFALCGLNLPSSGTHATPAPKRAHSGSHAETRRVIRVDGDDVLGSEIIDTIGPFQADQTVAVALAEGHRNAVSP